MNENPLQEDILFLISKQEKTSFNALKGTKYKHASMGAGTRP
jgi:hypothetical protein